MITLRKSFFYAQILLKKHPQLQKLPISLSMNQMCQHQKIFSLQNKYFFSQNQPHQNSKLNHSNPSCQNLSFQSKIFTKLKMLMKWLRNVAEKIGLILFFGVMGYLSLVFLLLGYFILVMIYFLIKPKPNQKKIWEKYQRSNKMLKSLKVDRIIPTLKRAEKAVFNKIRSKKEMILRVKGLRIHRQVIKHTKNSKTIANSRKIYPFKVYRKIYL